MSPPVRFTFQTMDVIQDPDLPGDPEAWTEGEKLVIRMHPMQVAHMVASLIFQNAG